MGIQSGGQWISPSWQQQELLDMGRLISRGRGLVVGQYMAYCCARILRAGIKLLDSAAAIPAVFGMPVLSLESAPSCASCLPLLNPAKAS